MAVVVVVRVVGALPTLPQFELSVLAVVQGLRGWVGRVFTLILSRRKGRDRDRDKGRDVQRALTWLESSPSPTQPRITK